MKVIYHIFVTTCPLEYAFFPQSQVQGIIFLINASRPKEDAHSTTVYQKNLFVCLGPVYMRKNTSPARPGSER